MARKTSTNAATRAGAAITIRDVAHQARVSMMTVSRVLNKESLVHAETRRKVLAVIDELGYRPNISARSLAASRSYFIGLIYLNPSPGYLGQFLVGALQRSRQLGFHVVLEDCSIPEERWADDAVQFYLDSKLGGIILPPPLSDSERVLDRLATIGASVVRVSPGKHDPRASSIRIDEYQAAYAMTRHLIDRGHRKIGFLRGAVNQGSSAVRYRGYADALRRAGLERNPAWIGHGGYQFRKALFATRKILADARARPTAIFASNDDMAAAACAAALEMGVEVPGQLSIAGFDDTPTAMTVWPNLTTVRQPISAMAARAVDLLADTARAGGAGPSAPLDQVLDFAIVVRDSVRRIA